MMNRSRLQFALSLSLFGMLLYASSASAQSCTPISAVPTTIALPGKYCLTQNLTYEGATPVAGQLDNAITIAADNVSVDFGGYTLSGGSNASRNPASAGVRASEKSNVAVRNGAIRNFGIGVQFLDPAGGVVSFGAAVEQMVIDGALLTGISTYGANTTVHDNRISNLASTSTTYSACGVVANGANSRVVANSVYNIVSATSTAIGICVDAANAFVQANSISAVNPGKANGIGLLISANAAGIVVKENALSNAPTFGFGILVSSIASATIDNNVISGFSTGISTSSANPVKYRNNVVNGATMPYTGGINLGGNN